MISQIFLFCQGTLMVLAFDNFQTYNEPKQNKTKLHYYKETSP